MVVAIIILSSLLALGLGIAAAQFAFRKDTEKENRRRAANKLASTLRSFGLRKIPDFLEDYGVGDYSGMATKIKNMVELFTGDPLLVVKEFEQVFERVLAAKLESPESLAYIKAKIADKESSP